MKAFLIIDDILSIRSIRFNHVGVLKTLGPRCVPRLNSTNTKIFTTKHLNVEYTNTVVIIIRSAQFDITDECILEYFNISKPKKTGEYFLDEKGEKMDFQ